jgi:small subunit ribosomal protein S8
MDQIANMLSVPYSGLKARILKVMEIEKKIKSVETKGRKNKILEITLIYDRNGKPAINRLRRVSKSSRRIYFSCKDIRPVKNGLGFMIISTAKGIMTDKEAKRNKVGGEIICEVW